MSPIRQATPGDAGRIAEIEVFNYRLNFYPVFRNDEYYFHELQVPTRMTAYRDKTGSVWVYDDGVVKGFMQVEGGEIRKLFIEPVLQGNSIGSRLITYAIERLGANFLWALEKNVRAISFYARHGFLPTGEKKLEEGTTEYLIRLERPFVRAK